MQGCWNPVTFHVATAQDPWDTEAKLTHNKVCSTLRKSREAFQKFASCLSTGLEGISRNNKPYKYEALKTLMLT